MNRQLRAIAGRIAFGSRSLRCLRSLAWALGLSLLLLGNPLRAGPPGGAQPAAPAPPARNENDLLNPLNFTGPHFLGFYCELAVVAVISAAFLRRFLRRPADAPPPEVVNLLPYEAAYLAGKEHLAINAAIARLVRDKALEVNPSERKLTAPGHLPAGANRLERAVYRAAAAPGGQSIRDVHKEAACEIGEIDDRLKDLGLLVEKPQARRARLLPLALVLCVLLLGLTKLGVGLSRHKPVVFLAMACAVTFVVALAGFGRGVHRSRRGDKALAQLRQENSALQGAAQRDSARLSESDFTLALGLFGLELLASGPLGDLHTALRPPAGAHGCSTGCGGGGCGGGGCGGGGCGGCGGG
jgi:uncharacterized protein (TIGR04222 family)